MNNLEFAVSAFTALATGTALFTAFKTLLDARKNSIKDFMNTRESRRKTQSKKNNQ